MFIYLLWYHGEDGPEGLKATLDREHLLTIAETYNEDGWFDSLDKSSRGSDPLNTLKTLLLKSDEVLSSEVKDGIHYLMYGWGGLHLQVVKAL
jgi:hypothetical protein